MLRYLEIDKESVGCVKILGADGSSVVISMLYEYVLVVSFTIVDIFI